MSIKRTIIQTVSNPDLPDWESRFMLLELPPGHRVPAHRHPVSGMVYVLAGTLISQFEGEKPETYGTGQSFIEAGIKLHVRVENASETEWLKVLVSYTISKGANYTVMEEQSPRQSQE